METRIIYHIEKFIAYLFGEKNKNDADQRIYNKLLQLEGEELEDWMGKIKGYINFVGYYSYHQGKNFGASVEPTRFEEWYFIRSLRKESELMKYDKIYDISDPEYARELNAIKLKLYHFQEPDKRNYGRCVDWKLLIMTDYMKMYIMTMSNADLKAYIIQQVEPVEIR
jgi:hypothetical protein